MAAWINSAPTTPALTGTYNYQQGFEIEKWHLKHPSFAGEDVLARWGASPSLVLGVERASDLGKKWKKEVQQTVYRAGTSTKVESSRFWLPVLIEGDPVLWDADRVMRINSPGHGCNGNSVARYVYHLPILATLTTVTDVVPLGSTGGSTLLTQFSPQLQMGSELNPGRHVATNGIYDYYWEDTAANPHFVLGTTSTTGPTVLNTSTNVNPYLNTTFLGKLSNFRGSGKAAQLYEYTELTVRGKKITPGMTWDGTGAPTSDYRYSRFAISVGNLSADPESFSGKIPVVVSQTDYDLIEAWKTASQTVPTKPSSTPVYQANGTDGLPTYMSSYASKWQQGTDGFTKHQTISWPNWTGTGASMQLGIGKWMVYPRYVVASPKDESLVTEDAALTIFNIGRNDASFPQKGKHFGVFDNSTDANAWVSFYNALLEAGSAKVTNQTGFLFVGGNDWSDGWKITINVDGIAGIVSSNSLLSNAGQSAPSVTTPGATDAPDAGAGGAGNPFRVTMAYAVNTVTKKNVNILIKQLMANEKLSFQKTKAKFIEEFVKARAAFLVKSGKAKSQAEAKSIAESRASVIFANATPNSNAGGTGATADAPGATTIRIPIVRGLIGYQPPPSALGDSPQLVQKYQYTKVSKNESGSEVQTLVPTERRFIFPFAPKDITYSNLSSVWTEISRTGRHPIVDWTGFQLLKVSFTFELVSRNSTDIAQPRDGFGLFYAIDEEINLLRQMATAPYPVSFLNMDTFFSKELRYPLYTQGRGIEFVITDFAVQSVQRTSQLNSNGQTTGQLNQISRASCTITLQECPIEGVDVISIPKITVCSKQACPPPTCKPPCIEKPKEFVTFSPLTNVDTKSTGTD